VPAAPAADLITAADGVEHVELASFATNVPQDPVVTAFVVTPPKFAGSTAVIVISIFPAAPAVEIDLSVSVFATPTAELTVVDWLAATVALEPVQTAPVLAVAAACAGTTDKSPNPSEATATADTFFNEIVFTIFLSFSQIKDDLLPGW